MKYKNTSLNLIKAKRNLQEEKRDKVFLLHLHKNFQKNSSKYLFISKSLTQREFNVTHSQHDFNPQEELKRMKSTNIKVRTKKHIPILPLKTEQRVEEKEQRPEQKRKSIAYEQPLYQGYMLSRRNFNNMYPIEVRSV